MKEGAAFVRPLPSWYEQPELWSSRPRQAPRRDEAAPVVAGERLHGDRSPGVGSVNEPVAANVDSHVGDAPAVGPEEDEVTPPQLIETDLLAIMSLTVGAVRQLDPQVPSHEVTGETRAVETTAGSAPPAVADPARREGVADQPRLVARRGGRLRRTTALPPPSAGAVRAADARATGVRRGALTHLRWRLTAGAGALGGAGGRRLGGPVRSAEPRPNAGELAGRRCARWRAPIRSAEPRPNAGETRFQLRVRVALDDAGGEAPGDREDAHLGCLRELLVLPGHVSDQAVCPLFAGRPRLAV